MHSPYSNDYWAQASSHHERAWVVDPMRANCGLEHNTSLITLPHIQFNQSHLVAEVHKCLMPIFRSDNE